jgi:hypothetical protein
MRTIIGATLLALLGTACGASFPVPVERRAEAESAERSAMELGAAEQPQAKLHLRLATDQIAEAKTAIENGENEKADSLLVRAKADAELAIALAREEAARKELQDALKTKESATK